MKKRLLLFLLSLILILCACGQTEAQAPQITEEIIQTPEPSPTPTPEPTPTPFVDYDFEIYGCTFNTADLVIDLNHITIEDNAEELLKYLPDCHNLEVLDMDFCGIDNERMAEIRDAYPEVEVIWRVWFGKGYSVRTNVVKILASNVVDGGNLTAKNCDGLYYCTKVKYLDIGHNNYNTDISFIKNMPDLEILITGQDCIYTSQGLRDITPIASCPKLEFIELVGIGITDLEPLANLTELKHLNIGADVFLTDISPIMNLDLERLWITATTPINREQVEQFKELHPDCEVNTWADPPMSGWKGDAPKYLEVKEIFNYHIPDYQLASRDPLYNEHESIYTDYVSRKAG